MAYAAQLLVRHPQIALGDIRQILLLQRQIKQVAHSFQRIVDLVRHGCGQPSCRRQLLGSPQQALRTLALLDIRGRAEPVRDLAQCIDQRLGPRQHPAVAAIRTPHAMLHLVRSLRAQRIDEYLRGPLAVLGMNQIQSAEGFIAQFGAGKGTPAFVHVLRFTRGPRNPHHLRDRLHQLHLLRPGLLQSVFRPVLRRHIFDDRDRRVRVARLHRAAGRR